MTGQLHTECFTRQEVVRLRHSLITSGQRAACPRCHSPVSVVVSANDRRLGACQVACDGCGGRLDIPDYFRGFILA